MKYKNNFNYFEFVNSIGLSDIEFKYASKFALSLSFLNPTNAIEFPGAYFLGLFNHAFISSIDHTPPSPVSASEYLKPSALDLALPKIPHKFGPILLPPPELKP